MEQRRGDTTGHRRNSQENRREHVPRCGARPSPLTARLTPAKSRCAAKGLGGTR